MRQNLHSEALGTQAVGSSVTLPIRTQIPREVRSVDLVAALQTTRLAAVLAHLQEVDCLEAHKTSPLLAAPPTQLVAVSSVEVQPPALVGSANLPEGALAQVQQALVSNKISQL